MGDPSKLFETSREICIALRERAAFKRALVISSRIQIEESRELLREPVWPAPTHAIIERARWPSVMPPISGAAPKKPAPLRKH